jgi:Flp pilus assembly protein TadG
MSGEIMSINNAIADTIDRSKSFLTNINGVAGIEAAFVFPVMLLMYFGLLDLTTVLSANRRVTQMASTLADLVTQSPGTTTKAELSGFYQAATAIMDPYSTTDLSLELFGYRRNGENVVLAWQNNNGATCGAAPPANTSDLKQLTSEGNDVITARVCYRVAPITGKVLRNGKVSLTDQMTLRPRQSARISCSDC